MALSLVMISCEGTSSTCSIMLRRRPMQYMYGTITCRPGEKVLTYLPNRSMVYSAPCGTVTMPFHSVTTTNTTNTQKKMAPMVIGVPCVGLSILRLCGRHRRALGQRTNALDDGVEAVAAVHGDVVFQSEPLEHRLHIEREDLARRAPRVELEQQRDQALDDVRVGIAAQLQPRRRPGLGLGGQPHLRHAAPDLV